MSDTKRNILPPGARIGPCEIVELIGHGGMGDVYRANHLALGKSVALKILAEPWAQKAEHVEGFLREAKLASRLEDQHIVQIYDVGSDAGKHFIVMQLAKGQSLRTRLKQGRLDTAQALEIVEKIATGLNVAHEQNIVHRDIKPHNVILSEDGQGLIILDFGLARFEQSLCEPEQIGEIVGSTAYMAPEQSDYASVDARADLYSLGVTAFQCLTGALPFGGTAEGGNFELLARQHFELPQAPSLLNRDVPLTVSRMVLRLLEKLPENRYQSAEEVLDELRLLRRHSLPVAPLPWKKRALNTPSLAPGEATANVFRQALVAQREAFRERKPYRPLHLQAKNIEFVWSTPKEQLRPTDILEISIGKGNVTLPLRDLVGGMTDVEYADRFRLDLSDDGKQLAIYITGAKSLEAMAAQRLYDLLESLPAWPKGVTLTLAPDYHVQPQDIRWVVDVFNLCGGRKASLRVVVGSSRNHDTFIHLGLDKHIKLELELERTTSIFLDEPKTKPAEPAARLAEAGSLPGMDGLAPAVRALVSALGRHLNRQEFDDAVRTWRLLSKDIDPENSSIIRPLKAELYNALFISARRAFEEGRIDPANDFFNLLVDLDPGRYEGHFCKGLVLKKQNKLDYASAFLTQAIIAAPDVAELFYHRAIVRSRLNDDAGALRDLNMAVEHNPRDANSYFNRSMLYKKAGRLDLARKDLEIAYRLNPELKNSAKLKRRTATSA
ncbi:MAG: protein kinase [Planctomycetes bacterium]|nr:protein kinase [Planctomycetota bacterium]